MKDVSKEEFRRIFLKNLFRRLIDSYMIQDENLKIIISKHIPVRDEAYETQLKTVSEKLAEMFMQKFSNESDANDMMKDEYKIKQWILETVKKI
ncbi:MAG: hypothetical protein ACREBJ_09120 [Nitrosotalea sp.]